MTPHLHHRQLSNSTARPDDATDDHDPERQASMLRSVDAHIALAQSCLPELQALYHQLSQTTKLPALSGLPSFTQALRDGLSSLLKLQAQLQSSSSLTADALTALAQKIDPCMTDISHAATHWSILRRSTALVAVNRTFQTSAQSDRRANISKFNAAATGREKSQLHRTLKEQAKTEVDVVAAGAEWLCIRWITRDRLARQMTDSGWSWGDYGPGDAVDEDEWEDIPLAKNIRKLVAAARMHRHEYRIPRLHIVLPKLSWPDDDVDIPVLLANLAAIDPGASITISHAASPFLTAPLPPLATSLSNLMHDDLATLTPTLNMDHTILVDLISDLSHARLTPQPWQAPTTRAQIADENTSPDGVMLRTLHPILAGRTLLCTREAAEHFHDMLATVGTCTERRRGRLLVPLHQPERSMDSAALRSAFQELSAHTIPQDIQLPVKVLPDDERWDVAAVCAAVDGGSLPAVARDVAEKGVGGGTLKSSKLSIYMYGWWSGHATLTSNKEIKAHMSTWVERGRTADDETGPRIWCVGVTRNLLAKSAEPPPGWTPGHENTSERGYKPNS